MRSPRRTSTPSAEPDQGIRKELLLQYAPIFLSAVERRDQTDFASAMGVGLSANLLMADYTQAYNGSGTAAFDPIDKWWRQVPVAFEITRRICAARCWPTGPWLGAWTSTWTICVPPIPVARRRRAAQPEHACLRVGAGIHRQAAGGGIQCVGSDARTPQPDALELPRRFSGLWYLHTNAVPMDYYSIPHSTGAANAELGNFEFYLYQVDSIPGGRTVAETNDKGADSRYAKDPSTGNPMPKLVWATVRPGVTTKRYMGRITHVTFSRTIPICRRWPGRTRTITGISKHVGLDG